MQRCRRRGRPGLILIGLALLGCWSAALAGSATAAPAGAFVGQVYGFGDNRGGQLGNEVNIDEQEPNPVPTAVSVPGQEGPITGAAVGSDQSLVLTEAGELYAFGYNYYGQLGNELEIEGHGPNGWVTTPTPVVLPAEDGPVTQAAAATWSSLAVTADGKLFAFGDNDHGELGNETNVLTQHANPTPTAVTLPGEVGPVVEAAGGAYFSLALTESGQVYAFGSNGYGQLGRPHSDPPNEKANPTPTPVTLPGEVGTVTKIAAGGEYALAITSSGQLYSWGENRYGQLGYAENSGAKVDPSENEHPTPTLVTLPGAIGTPTQIAAGTSHTLVLTSGGQLYAFGDNRAGELGSTTGNGNSNGEGGGYVSAPTLVTLPGARGRIVQISAGYEASYALTSAGQLYSFGLNYLGELGRSTDAKTLAPNPTPTPVKVAGGAPVGAIGVGQRAMHMLATVAMLIATSSLPKGTVGAPYEAPVAVEGGEGPYEWSASGLPAGLSISPASGTIAGTPALADCTRALCREEVAVTAVDAEGKEVTESLTLELAGRGPEGPPGGGGEPGHEGPPGGGGKTMEPAGLKIAGVHRAGRGRLAVTVTGRIARSARGSVTVEVIGHAGARRVVASRRARIFTGSWGTRIALPRVATRPSVRVSVTYAGDAEHLAGRAERRARLG